MALLKSGNDNKKRIITTDLWAIMFVIKVLLSGAALLILAVWAVCVTPIAL